MSSHGRFKQKIQNPPQTRATIAPKNHDGTDTVT